MAKEVNNYVGDACRRLLDFEIWIVLFLILFGIIFPKIIPAALIGIVFFVTVRILIFGKPSKRTPIDYSLVIFCIPLLTAFWVTPDLNASIVQVLRIFIGIGLFYATINWLNDFSRLKYLVFTVVAAGVGLALVSPWIIAWEVGDLIFFHGLYQNLSPILDDTANPNVLAGVLIMVVPLVLAEIFSLQGKIFNLPDIGKKSTYLGRFVIYIIILVLLVSAVLFTQSRGAVIASLLSLLFFFSVNFKKGWIIAAGCGIAFVGWLLFVGNAKSLEELISSSSVQGIPERVELWSRAIYAIQEHGFTGIGIGSFDRVISALYPYPRTYIGRIDHAHNIFLQIAVDLGIPGLVGWIAVSGTVLMSGIILLREKSLFHLSEVRLIVLGLLSSQIAMFLHALIDSVHWGIVKTSPVLWFYWGMIISVLLIVQNPIVDRNEVKFQS